MGVHDHVLFNSLEDDYVQSIDFQDSDQEDCASSHCGRVMGILHDTITKIDLSCNQSGTRFSKMYSCTYLTRFEAVCGKDAAQSR